MSLIPEEELKRQERINLAPMVDFLFLVIAVLACLAVARAALYDTKVELVQVQPQPKDEPVSLGESRNYVILSIDENGRYKWLSDFTEMTLNNAKDIQEELQKQHHLGMLPEDKSQVKVLVQIDKAAKWESVAELIFAVREAGFVVHPVYEPQ